MNKYGMITAEILIRFIQNNVGSSFLKQQLMTRGIEAKPESAHFRACMWDTDLTSKKHHCRYLLSTSMSTRGGRNQSWSRLKPVKQDIFEEMGLRSKGDRQYVLEPISSSAFIYLLPRQAPWLQNPGTFLQQDSRTVLDICSRCSQRRRIKPKTYTSKYCTRQCESRCSSNNTNSAKPRRPYRWQTRYKRTRRYNNGNEKASGRNRGIEKNRWFLHPGIYILHTPVNIAETLGIVSSSDAPSTSSNAPKTSTFKYRTSGICSIPSARFGL